MSFETLKTDKKLLLLQSVMSFAIDFNNRHGYNLISQEDYITTSRLKMNRTFLLANYTYLFDSEE